MLFLLKCFDCLGLGVLWSDHRTRDIPGVESLPFGLYVHAGHPLAVHTNETLLSTGAWMDFSQHINMLVLRGDVDEAGALWGLVFEMVYMGVDPATPVLQSMDMPPIRRMPCCKTPCVRYETGRGGFQFPFIGPALQPP